MIHREGDWELMPRLRAVNLNGGANYNLQQCWVNWMTGAEEWRDIPVLTNRGGVVWADMSSKTGGE